MGRRAKRSISAQVVTGSLRFLFEASLACDVRDVAPTVDGRRCAVVEDLTGDKCSTTKAVMAIRVGTEHLGGCGHHREGAEGYGVAGV